MSNFNLAKQIKLAKKELLIQKALNPSVFPEYQHLMDCMVRKNRAIREYEEALSIWEKLGK